MMKAIWITPLTLEDVNQRAKNTLSDHLGIVFTEVGDNFLTATMTINDKTIQPMKIMHGGASAALAETVGSAAGNYCVDQRQYVCVGLDLNINHIQPAVTGKVSGMARPFHLGRATQVWDIKITDEKNTLIAISRLTLLVLSRNK